MEIGMQLFFIKLFKFPVRFAQMHASYRVERLRECVSLHVYMYAYAHVCVS